MSAKRSPSTTPTDVERRRRAAAATLGSVRAEGLEPGAEVEELLDRWVAGELTGDDLGELAKAAAAGESLTRVPPRAA